MLCLGHFCNVFPPRSFPLTPFLFCVFLYWTQRKIMTGSREGFRNASQPYAALYISIMLSLRSCECCDQGKVHTSQSLEEQTSVSKQTLYAFNYRKRLLYDPPF